MANSSTVPGMTNARLWLVLGSLMLSVLLASMEISIIATALPTIAGEFNAFDQFAWVGTAYIAAAAISTPLLGRFSDIYGRRIILQVALGLFIVGSLLCGLSQSMNQLIGFRVIQGFGGGAIQALAFAVLGDILPPRERGRYIGYFTLAFVGAALFGPLIGGFIIEQWSWPWIFFINVPLASIAAVVSWFTLDLPFPRRPARIDIAGALLLAVTIGSLVIGLEVGGTHGWTDPLVATLAAVVVVGLVVFVLVERRASEPMIPLHLFSNRVVLTCVIAGSCAGAITFGAGQFLPLYFQDSLFVSPTESGLRMLPQMIGVTIGTFGIGRLILRTGRYKTYPIVGTTLCAAGLYAVSHITGTTTYAWLIVPMIAIGFGVAAVFTSTSIATQNAGRLPRPRRRHRHDHVLPHARWIDRARGVRDDPHLDGAQRGAAEARCQRRRGSEPGARTGRHRRAPRRESRCRRRGARLRRRADLPRVHRDHDRRPHRRDPDARARTPSASRPVRCDGGEGHRVTRPSSPVLAVRQK